jgi:hypothetical protein
VALPLCAHSRRAEAESPGKPLFHLCIVNLVIGACGDVVLRLVCAGWGGVRGRPCSSLAGAPALTGAVSCPLITPTRAGTLYCAKGNFEFGVSRVLKSLEPLSRRLGTDTWYYAKRCA